MIIDIHRHSAVRMILLTIIAVVTASCELPKDKIIDYSKLTGTITGFSRPTYMKCVGNHLYVADENGLYRINLAQIDFSGAAVTSSDLYYKNNSISPYGSVRNFDVSGDTLFLATINSSSYYILNIDMSAASLSDGLKAWTVPNGRSANYITICDDILAITGNANTAVKGFVHKDSTGDIVFDTTADYCYAKDYSGVDNITVNSMKPIAVKNGNKYEIYIISGDNNQMGIRKYLYDADSTSDNVYLKGTCNTTLYPMDIQFRPNDPSTIISSETSGVCLYKMTADPDDILRLSKTNTIGLGEDNGALKALPYSSNKLAVLYGYQVRPNEYDEHAYDIMAYWYGIKIISGAYGSSPKVETTYTMEGWGTDFAIFGNYVLAADQVHNRINIIKLD
ncbi:MAG: hypothetical protein IKQ61_08765 [Spirochaetales bacterium]|nr:hypothetical protein [Spirochaetales bacterium]